MKSICAVGIAAIMATMTGCTGLSKDYQDKLKEASKETTSLHNAAQEYGWYVDVGGTVDGERCFRPLVEADLLDGDSYTLSNFEFSVSVEFDGKKAEGYDAETKWMRVTASAAAADKGLWELNHGDFWINGDTVTFMPDVNPTGDAYSVTNKKYAKRLNSFLTLAQTNMDITQSKMGALFKKYMKKAGKGKATLSHVIEEDADTEDYILSLPCDVYAVQLTTAEANALQKAIGKYMDVIATPLLGDTLKASDFVKTYTDDEKYQLCLYVSNGVPVGISQISIDAGGKKSVTTVEMWTTGEDLYAGITSDSINAEFIGKKQKSGKYNGTLTTNSGCTIVTVKDFDYEQFITTGKLYGAVSTNEYENAQRVDAGDRLYYMTLAKKYPEKAESYMKMAQNANSAEALAAKYTKRGIDVNTLETGITFDYRFGDEWITLYQKDKKGDIYNICFRQIRYNLDDFSEDDPKPILPIREVKPTKTTECTMAGFEEQINDAELTAAERLMSIIAVPKKDSKKK